MSEGSSLNSPLKLCVYCSASSKIDDRYKEISRLCAESAADMGYDLVYGGASGGLMGIVADTFLEKGRHVSGFIPEHLMLKERAHKGISELVITKNLQQRQTKMAEMADIFLVLPGGLGTLAEFTEVLTWNQLGLQQKPIILLSAYNFWNPLIKMFETMENEHCLHSDVGSFLNIVDSLEKLKEILSLFRIERNS